MQNRAAGVISPRFVIFFVLQFVSGSLGPIARLLWLPTLLQAVTLYFCLRLYFLKLTVFLQQPGEYIAGQALGILSVGLLSALFFAGMAIVGLAKLAAGKQLKSSWFYFRCGPDEWQFFITSAKFLLIFLFFLGVSAILTAIDLRILGISPDRAMFVQSWFGATASTFLLFFLYLRLGFFIPSLVVDRSKKILRQSWRLSGYSSARLGIVVIGLSSPGIVMQFGGEFLLRNYGVVPASAAGSSVLDLTTSVLIIYPYLFSLCMVSYLLLIIPLTVAAEKIYSGVTPDQMVAFQ